MGITDVFVVTRMLLVSGGPMQRAFCPKRQRNIGGTQHRLQAGNQHAGLDGARDPACQVGLKASSDHQATTY